MLTVEANYQQEGAIVYNPSRIEIKIDKSLKLILNYGFITPPYSLPFPNSNVKTITSIPPVNVFINLLIFSWMTVS